MAEPSSMECRIGTPGRFCRLPPPAIGLATQTELVCKTPQKRIEHGCADAESANRRSALKAFSTLVWGLLVTAPAFAQSPGIENREPNTELVITELPPDLPGPMSME